MPCAFSNGTYILQLKTLFYIKPKILQEVIHCVYKVLEGFCLVFFSLNNLALRKSGSKASTTGKEGRAWEVVFRSSSAGYAEVERCGGRRISAGSQPTPEATGLEHFHTLQGGTILWWWTPLSLARPYSLVVKVTANSFHSRIRAPGEARVGSQRNLDFSGQHLPKAKFLIT